MSSWKWVWDAQTAEDVLNGTWSWCIHCSNLSAKLANRPTPENRSSLINYPTTRYQTVTYVLGHAQETAKKPWNRFRFVHDASLLNSDCQMCSNWPKHNPNPPNPDPNSLTTQPTYTKFWYLICDLPWGLPKCNEVFFNYKWSTPTQSFWPNLLK